jgi:hypothetical protein
MGGRAAGQGSGRKAHAQSRGRSGRTSSAGRTDRAGRPRRGCVTYGVFAAVFVVLLGVTLHMLRPGATAGQSGIAGRAGAAPTGRGQPADPARTPDAGGAPAKTKAPAPTATDVPQHGSGSFSTADAAGKAVGRGRIRRYEVQVEQGAGISADGAAHEIEAILADPRGWTDDGHDGFQLVSSGPVDFVVKIATPDTVDAICGAAGLHTHGEVNCDVGPTVVVNLKRWLLGSPEFPGPIAGYRALIINHEVGHRIGHGHETCPGPGRLAPVMMQQIDGLHGCKANAWPYDSAGHYIQGPRVP